MAQGCQGILRPLDPGLPESRGHAKPFLGSRGSTCVTWRGPPDSQNEASCWGLERSQPEGPKHSWPNQCGSEFRHQGILHRIPAVGLNKKVQEVPQLAASSQVTGVVSLEAGTAPGFLHSPKALLTYGATMQLPFRGLARPRKPFFWGLVAYSCMYLCW